MIRLRIFKDVKVRLPKQNITRLFDKVIKEESESGSGGCINLIFTSDNRIKKLNKGFRNKDKSTDVLSFNIDKPNHSDAVVGEIYISIPTASKQANEYGTSLNEELLRLVCHGLLHLHGYDHVKATERKSMEKREQYYLSNLVTRK